MRLHRLSISFGLLLFLGLVPVSDAQSSSQSQLPMRGNVNIVGYTPGKGDHNDNMGRDYYAVDLTSDNLAVYPIAPGKVVYAEFNCDKVGVPQETPCDQVPPPFYGYTVAIDHGNGIYSIYAHLATSGFVSVGQEVGYDTRIGTMSNSGCPDCLKHLHFAVHQGREGLTGTDALWRANTC